MKSESPETRAFREEIAKYIPRADAERISHVVASGRGGVYTDLDGREYLDFSSGVLTNSFAHGDEELSRAFYGTYSSLANIHGRQWAGATDFYRRLFPFLPSPDYRAVPYGDGGGYTVDRAEVELYYHFGKRRYRLATFQGGFHGKTQGTKMSLNQEESSAYFQAFSLPAPYCYRCPCSQTKTHCHMECAAAAEDRLAQCGAEAFLFEPILGGAVIVPPDGYWERLQDFCRKRRILMIADEVLTGGGRSGSVIAGSAWKLEPDVILLSKGLANGLPLSLMLLKKNLTENPFARRELHYSSTYIGVPALMAVGAKVLEKLERDHILDNVRRQGERLRLGLEALRREFPDVVGDVRSVGLMAAVEFVKAGSRTPDAAMGQSVFRAAEQNGLELIPTGHIVRIAPALNATDAEMSLGMERLRKSMEEVLR